MKRNIFAIFLVCALCGAMTGCGVDSSVAEETSRRSRREAEEAETASVTETTAEETTTAAETTVMTTQTSAADVSAESLLTGELKNKTIHFMANWDITTEPNDAYTLFQSRYDGEIVYHQVDWNNRFDSLATAVIGDDGIDFFSVSDLDAFPRGAIKDMFEPVDDVLSMSDPAFSDLDEVWDLFQWKGKHYVIPTVLSGDNCVVIYNRDTVAQYGLSDPSELLEKGEWNWDTFQEMLEQFVSPENERYGIDGWWFEAGLSASCGVPYIGMENGKLVNNLTDPAVERVQNWMYELGTENLVAIGSDVYGWNAHPEYIGEGKLLFYPCGTWTLCDDMWKHTYGENAMFVPMPKDPNANAYYIPCLLQGYAIVKGAPNPEGVVKYAACERAVELDAQYQANADEELKNTYGWTDEMVSMLHLCNDLAQKHPFFDFYNSTSTDLTSLLDSNENGIRAASKGFATWNESVSAINSVVESYLKEYNGG